MTLTKSRRNLAIRVSLGLAVLAASTNVMAETRWTFYAINDTGQSINGFDLIFDGVGTGITDPLGVTPPDIYYTFTAPPPANEIDASFSIVKDAGEPIAVYFSLTTGLTPTLTHGTWTFDGAPVGLIDPNLVRIDQVPEPGTLSLLGLGLLCLLRIGIRRTRQ